MKIVPLMHPSVQLRPIRALMFPMTVLPIAHRMMIVLDLQRRLGVPEMLPDQLKVNASNLFVGQTMTAPIPTILPALLPTWPKMLIASIFVWISEPLISTMMIVLVLIKKCGVP